VARTSRSLPERCNSGGNYGTLGNRRGIEGFSPAHRLAPILDRAHTPGERRPAAYASLQRTCGKEFISSRRLRRTRLHPSRFRLSLFPDDKGPSIVRRILGGKIANRFSRSHFRRRRRVGGVQFLAKSLRRIAPSERFVKAERVRQEVVVKVGR